MKHTFPPRPEFPAVSPEDVDAGQWEHHKRELLEWFEALAAHPHVQAVMHIPGDEPIFVLRSQDRHSTKVVTEWILIADANGGISNKKYEDADADRTAMMLWQEQNPRKVKQPD